MTNHTETDALIRLIDASLKGQLEEDCAIVSKKTLHAVRAALADVVPLTQDFVTIRKPQTLEEELLLLKLSHLLVLDAGDTLDDPVSSIALQDGGELRKTAYLPEESGTWALYRGGKQIRYLDRFENDFVDSALAAYSTTPMVRYTAVQKQMR